MQLGATVGKGKRSLLAVIDRRIVIYALSIHVVVKPAIV